MNDELNVRTKTDVLDLVISFIMEHEKQMDTMTERLERIAEKLSRNDYRLGKDTPTAGAQAPQHGTFTITINNPEEFERIKSIKIDWETDEDMPPSQSPEMDSILSDIEYTLKDD